MPEGEDFPPGMLLPAGSSAGLLATLADFVGELRSAGIPVSLTENLDAIEALRHVPLGERDAVKYALAATLVKADSHWRVFETIFEVFFAHRGEQYRLGHEPSDDEGEELVDALLGAPRGDPGGGMEALSAEQLAELLLAALRDGDRAMLDALARVAVARYAGMEPGRPVGGTYYLYRTLRQLDPDALLARLLDEEAAAGAGDELDQRLVREEYESRLEALRKAVEAEIRRRLVADRGPEAVARSVRRPLPEDIEFMHASREELAALRKAIAPLTRKLAVRLARKRRRGRRGPLDFRATVRKSLSAGGVPVEPVFRPPHPSKPEIFVVADISGSVAAFARFTLQLVYSLSSQFSRVRAFAFIDGVDEVTDYLKGAEDMGAAIQRINAEADVIWVDGHSDYGHALEAFWDRFGAEVKARTTVLVLGDARNNYHASGAWVLAELSRRARSVYWLDPEPRSYWDTGDSILGQYAPHCDGVYECRNLAQLERFVEQLG